MAMSRSVVSADGAHDRFCGRGQLLSWTPTVLHGCMGCQLTPIQKKIHEIFSIFIKIYVY